MEPQSLGDLELEVLQFVAEHRGISVADVAREFAGRRGLARTTILTVMERLRTKGQLSRRQVGSSFHYFSRQSKAKLLHSLVSRFMDRALGGSIDPFVAYLMGDVELTDEQIAELRRVVEQAERKKRKGANDDGDFAICRRVAGGDAQGFVAGSIAILLVWAICSVAPRLCRLADQMLVVAAGGGEVVYFAVLGSTSASAFA